jgi:trehalose 6-phosphate synthase
MRLILVSNRLPQELLEPDTGRPVCSGGLAHALAPVFAARECAWIGWDGRRQGGDALVAANGAQPLSLPPDVVDRYYTGFCNQTLWPLLHGRAERCRFDPHDWAAYLEANRLFAEAVVRSSGAEDLLWVHDYHLMPLAQCCKELGAPRRAAFFLHTPFPEPVLFGLIPWRGDLLLALDCYESLGFQTEQDRAHYLEARARFHPGPSGEGPLALVAPAAPDVGAWRDRARLPETRRAAQALRAGLGGVSLLLGVDRLDYVKGVAQRLRAFGELLERAPQRRGTVSFLQIVAPSREDIPAYQNTRAEIEAAAASVNQRFERPGWTPIDYRYAAHDCEALAAAYLAADALVVTPWRDGMNLVALEFCCCKSSEEEEQAGSLVLSASAGAASFLHENGNAPGALLVDPTRPEDLVAALVLALDMPVQERRKRMEQLQRRVFSHDALAWAGRALEGLQPAVNP